MIITGPTDLVDDQDGKKANQALEWLLTNWSAVADGLLEPDFDVEVEAIVEPQSEERSSPPMIPLSPTIVRSFDSPSSPRAAPAPPSASMKTGPFPALPPPVPVESSKEAPTTSADDIPRYLDTLDDDDEDSRHDEEDLVTENDSSATKTPTTRPQSDSSYATSIETPPTRSFDDRRGSRKTVEPTQLSPEDERGEFSDFADPSFLY
jgi:hypothetical protein